MDTNLTYVVIALITCFSVIRISSNRELANIISEIQDILHQLEDAQMRIRCAQSKELAELDERIASDKKKK